METPISAPAHRLLRRKQVEQLLGITRSTVYARLDPKSRQFDPAFPQPVRRGALSSIAWVESEVQAYIAHLIADSRKAAPAERIAQPA